MTPTQHATVLLFEERLADLADRTHWFRRILPGIAPSLKPAYASMFQDWRAELRVLNGLRGKARRIARAAEMARTGEIDRRVDHVLDAIEDRRRRAYDEGWDYDTVHPEGREGQPEFNGSFR